MGHLFLSIVDHLLSPWRRSQQRGRRLLAIAGANLLPVIGVVALGWSVWTLLALYWLENVVIGAANVVRMWLARGPMTFAVDAEVPMTLSEPRMLRWLSVPFFVFHYGMFCAAHGFFALVILPSSIGAVQLEHAYDLGAVIVDPPVMLSFAAVLALVHVGELRDWIRRGEAQRSSSMQLMGAPYGRVVVLHLALLFGGIAISAVGNPLPLLVALVGVKSVAELWTARRKSA